MTLVIQISGSQRKEAKGEERFLKGHFCMQETNFKA